MLATIVLNQLFEFQFLANSHHQHGCEDACVTIVDIARPKQHFPASMRALRRGSLNYISKRK